MALIDVTPVMTSNTTPSPYVVKASSIYDSRYDAWQAFNGTNSSATDCWHSSSEINPYIQIDFGKETYVSCIHIMTRNGTCIQVKTEVLGSMDDKIYEKIGEITLPNTANTKVELDFGKMTRYRYYKIRCIDASATYFVIGTMSFLYNEDYVNDSLQGFSKSSTYQLPMNTTQAILAKTNDPREGLMGMANDVENYGDLYVVGKDGKSHLTKAGMKSEVIFEGKVSTLNAIGTLLKDIRGYKKLEITASVDISSNIAEQNVMKITNIIELKNVNYRSHEVFFNFSLGTQRNINIQFLEDNKTFKVTSLVLGNLSSIQITRIVGIY